MQGSNSIFILVIIFIILITLGLYFFQTDVTKVSPESATVIPNVVHAPSNEATSGFPDDIPLNANAEIVNSYSATYPNSTAEQSTVVFVSSKTPKENYDFYNTWTENNEWQIINQTDLENIKALYLRKDKSDINITITNESISISYVEF